MHILLFKCLTQTTAYCIVSQLMRKCALVYSGLQFNPQEGVNTNCHFLKANLSCDDEELLILVLII